MSFSSENLWKLLPAIHRVRDAELGAAIARRYGRPLSDAEQLGPLRQLINVIAGQAAVLEEGLEQLYENHFVETAAPWALPYLGDLLGIRGLSARTGRVRAPRAEVGHTIGYRRRKGTAAVLEQLARDTTGWPARAVEFFERLAADQYLNHVRLSARATASLRNASALEFVDSPFETLNRTVEVRRIEPGRGKWNIPNVGLFLWRLQAYSLTQSPVAPPVTGSPLADGRHFWIHPLGLDAPVYSLPTTEDQIEHLAEPVNVPLAITRRMLCGESPATLPTQFHPSDVYYGDDRSIQLSYDETQKIPADAVLVADLSDRVDGGGNLLGWFHDNRPGLSDTFVLLDPVLGRVVFPKTKNPDGDLLTDVLPLVTFHYGFSANVGSGEYDRARSVVNLGDPVLRVDRPTPADLTPISATLHAPARAASIIEITSSARFDEPLSPIDATSERLVIRAVDGVRPTVIPTGIVNVTGDEAGSLSLDGLAIVGKQLRVTDPVGRVRLSHCTVFGERIVTDRGKLKLTGAVAIRVQSGATTLELSDCIVGPIRVATDVVVKLRNCVVDAGAFNKLALGPLNDTDGPAGNWEIENCTIVGTSQLAQLTLGSSTIFGGQVNVLRRQEGCVRFSWLAASSVTPRRYRCISADDDLGIRPAFTSRRYGEPAYAQLTTLTPPEIRRGGDQDGEMGVFHDLYQFRRETYLRARLQEFLRLGLEAGVFFAS